jgi:hypothetical protein
MTSFFVRVSLTFRVIVLEENLSLFEILGVQDTGHVAFLDSLESKGGNEGGTNTATVFGSENLDRIFFLGVRFCRPVKNLPQGHSTTSLEMGVFVKHRTICTHVARLVSLLLAYSSHAACREASSACTNQLSKSADEFKLRESTLDVEPCDETVIRLLKILEWVPSLYVRDTVLPVIDRNSLFNGRQE